MAKKTKRIITTLLMACFCCTAAVVVNAQNGSDQPVDFQIGDMGSIDIPIYRTPVVVPVQGYYVSFLNTLYLSFVYDVGVVNITVENIYTGECITGSTPTDIGVLAVPLGSGSGFYIITISRDNGQRYVAKLHT